MNKSRLKKKKRNNSIYARKTQLFECSWKRNARAALVSLKQVHWKIGHFEKDSETAFGMENSNCIVGRTNAWYLSIGEMWSSEAEIEKPGSDMECKGMTKLDAKRRFQQLYCQDTEETRETRRKMGNVRSLYRGLRIRERKDVSENNLKGKCEIWQQVS